MRGLLGGKGFNEKKQTNSYNETLSTVPLRDLELESNRFRCCFSGRSTDESESDYFHLSFAVRERTKQDLRLN